MKIDISRILGWERTGLTLKIIFALGVAYGLFCLGTYAWPRVQCAVAHPSIKAGSVMVRMKGCWVLDEATVLRGYETYILSEWPPSEDSKRLTVTLDQGSDPKQIAGVGKAVTFAWGNALEIVSNSKAEAGKSRGALLFLPEHRAWLSTPEADLLTEIDSLGR
jgi:hypothetical protein